MYTRDCTEELASWQKPSVLRIKVPPFKISTKIFALASGKKNVISCTRAPDVDTGSDIEPMQYCMTFQKLKQHIPKLLAFLRTEKLSQISYLPNTTTENEKELLGQRWQWKPLVCCYLLCMTGGLHTRCHRQRNTMPELLAMSNTCETLLSLCIQ